MRVTRRGFLGMSGCAAAAHWVCSPSELFGAASGVVLRKSLAALTETSQEIKTLKLAVKKMKALPPSDRRSWTAQAAIHGSIAGGFGKCRHASWFFLPWHRAYLRYFEQICRTLGGDPTFALPYWDWSATHRIPAYFFGADNPLANPSRSGVPQSGRRRTAMDQFSQGDLDEFVGTARISSLLNTSDFETFGGGAVDTIDGRSFQGSLENGPHNFIHRWVGGDMATGGSPFDAIFWMHHCNVDRLWSEWTIKHPGGLPNDARWLDGDFQNHFVDGQGNPVASIKVRELLSTESLGYRYRDSGPITGVAPAAEIRTVAEAVSQAREPAPDWVAFALQPDAKVRSAISDVTLGKKSQPGLRMVISGIKTPENEDVSLRVFVNCEKLSKETPVKDPSYVGSCTFFGHGGHHDGHDEDGVSFALDVSPAFRRLYGDRPFGADEPLKVAVVAVPLFGDGKPSIQEIDPKNVRFDVVQTLAPSIS